MSSRSLLNFISEALFKDLHPDEALTVHFRNEETDYIRWNQSKVRQNTSVVQKELSFEFDNHPHHFIDLETAEELKVHPSQVKETYLRAISAYHKELKLKCAQYRIDLIDADINQGFHQVLQAYIIKRSRMS